ncbi:MAG TPA: hypothetical protein DCP97_04940, partial [Ruminococcaceae bacterium]|nr:hypothetical protein [Oscillospiraceae bacterium]
CCRDNFSTLCRIDFANKACGFYSGDNPNEFYRRFLNTIDSKDNMLTELTRAVTACCWVAGLVAQKACRSELYADYSCHSLAV